MSDDYLSASLRRLVHERARGQCEYCLIPDAVTLAPHEVDHIIAQKHGGATNADNLALSCALCNKRKGSDIASIDPDTHQIVPLYHPRRDRWAEHFQLSDGVLVPLTPEGRATLRLLQLNRPERVAERELLITSRTLHLPD